MKLKRRKPRRKKPAELEGSMRDDGRGENGTDRLPELSYNRRLRAGFRLLRGYTDWSD